MATRRRKRNTGTLIPAKVKVARDGTVKVFVNPRYLKNPNYEVIPYKRWENKITGRTASIYTGSLPGNRSDWHVVQRGWTVFNKSTGTSGLGRTPFNTKGEAEAWVVAHGR